ncbi:RHS repeat domain-containing protein [Sorangium sp. So ce1335]|uniref:RHS repeat domain-containing protein n=1 Tax=Sorangium sp. So ce1335 TaxID=3133335 RepID=UPI003F6143AD
MHLHHISGEEETAYHDQHLTLRDGRFITKHIYAGQTRIASKMDPDWFRDPPTIYYHPDHLGSTSFASNNEQTLTQRDEYFPTGELWIDASDSRYELRRAYVLTGKELDQATGLYYFGARYYDPRMSVWLSPDPILDEYMQGGWERGFDMSIGRSGPGKAFVQGLPIDEGKALLLGADLFRSVASEERPAWIEGVLESVLAATQLDFMGFGQTMVAICRDKSAWGTAEGLFLELRRVSLNAEYEISPLERAMVDLLETSTKVVFNASGAQPGFDAHAGARVLPLAWRIMTLVAEDPGRDAALRRVEEALWRRAEKGR